MSRHGSGPQAYERRGDLNEQRGDTSNAIRYHGKLVELWKGLSSATRGGEVRALRKVKMTEFDPFDEIGEDPPESQTANRVRSWTSGEIYYELLS